MTLTIMLTFAAMASLLIISPGPNGVLIAKTVPTSGKAAGFANIVGFMIAFYIHGTFAIFGLSVLLLQSAELFLAVKLISASYLIWIGVKSLRESFATKATTLTNVVPARRERTLLKAFFEGFLTNALNPKVAMFYLAAFPQFIPQESASMSAAYALVTVHALLNFAWFAPMVFLFGKLSSLGRSEKMQRYLKRITGLVFVGFGVRLATLRP